MLVAVASSADSNPFLNKMTVNMSCKITHETSLRQNVLLKSRLLGAQVPGCGAGSSNMRKRSQLSLILMSRRFVEHAFSSLHRISVNWRVAWYPKQYSRLCYDCVRFVGNAACTDCYRTGAEKLSVYVVLHFLHTCMFFGTLKPIPSVGEVSASWLDDLGVVFSSDVASAPRGLHPAFCPLFIGINQSKCKADGSCIYNSECMDLHSSILIH
jgi:hypothetical protein